MLKKWIVCAAWAALVGVAPAAAQGDGGDAAVVLVGGGVGSSATAVVLNSAAKTGLSAVQASLNLVFGAGFAGMTVAALIVNHHREKKAAERAECDALPRFQPRELREQGVENRVQCRRRHRGVEPGRFQPTFNRQASREFTPTRESCAAYWRLSPRFRVQCRGVALERLDAWAASGPDQPSAVLPAAAVERLRADALERQRFEEIAQERERRAGEQADR